MKTRPILFSAPMVLALLDGSKTQTRRIVNPADLARSGAEGVELWTGFMGWQPAEVVLADQSLSTSKATRCPYGQPGDRLYVRETWAQPAALDPGPTVYRADYPACVPPQYENVPSADEITWKPSIYMPRALSRIMLEIVSVRVERLNDCSAHDAVAEGIRRIGEGFERWHPDPDDTEHTGTTKNPVLAYKGLWESINGAGSWASNPWVWVVEFQRVQP